MVRIGQIPPSRDGQRRLSGRSFEQNDDDQLYEENGESVSSVELPGFDSGEIDLAWDDGMLGLAVEHDDRREETRTYYRRFRFPKNVDDGAITAGYTNGILEVRLPVQRRTVHGTEIEVGTDGESESRDRSALRSRTEPDTTGQQCD